MYYVCPYQVYILDLPNNRWVPGPTTAPGVTYTTPGSAIVPIGYNSAFILNGIELNGEDTIVNFMPSGEWVKVEMSLPYTQMVIYVARVPAGFFKCN